MSRVSEVYRCWKDKNGKYLAKIVEKRTKETRKDFEISRAALEKFGLPFYESRRLGGTADMHPDGFRDEHKSVTEWRDQFRKPKPGACCRAFIASWWQPMPNNPARWVPVFHLDDTVFIKGRSLENISARLAAGEKLTLKEKAKILEADLGM